MVNRYKDRVVAYLWELDTGDNLLTDEIETKVPDEEMAIYHKFNPQRSVPTFVFGCRYVRVGTVYEAQNDLTKEEADFQKVIEALLTQ
ncbi:hypothetical protein KY318_02065 [Candidatus Woesearchaeota archaeon]|nr:hypothetical protein [Candidatus Woesearchaeota archaeon]